MLPARHRLRRSGEFSAVVRGVGAARSGGRFVVLHGRYARPMPEHATQAGPRVGFVVPKAVGGAVRRNRTKRVLRHLVADRLARVPDGVDLVVRATPAAAEATSARLATELDRSLDTLLRRLVRS